MSTRGATPARHVIRWQSIAAYVLLGIILYVGLRYAAARVEPQRLLLRSRWDFTDMDEVNLLRMINMADLNVTNGVFSARSETEDPVLELKIGKPLAAEAYKILRFRMWCERDLPANEGWQMFWWTELFKRRDYDCTVRQPVKAGWHEYEMDLDSPPLEPDEGNGIGWSHSIVGLRLDPVSAADVRFELDYLALEAR